MFAYVKLVKKIHPESGNLADEPPERVNTARKLVNQNNKNLMYQKTVRHLLFCIALTLIIFNFSILRVTGQSLKLKNATKQELLNSAPSHTIHTYFILFGVKGNFKKIQPDSLCLKSYCLAFADADTNKVKYEFVRGKKSTILEIKIETNSENPDKNNAGESENLKLTEAWFHYHSGTKAKKVAIQSFHQLPSKTE